MFVVSLSRVFKSLSSGPNVLMISSSVPNPNALNNVVTGCFLVRSTLTEMISLESVSYSSHAPLLGMMVVEKRLLFDLSAVTA